MGECTEWWERVLSFAMSMIRRFEEKERDGWTGFEDISEQEYVERAIKNINKGNYVDAANLCLLADWVRPILDFDTEDADREGGGQRKENGDGRQ